MNRIYFLLKKRAILRRPCSCPVYEPVLLLVPLLNLGRFCSGFRGLGPNTSSIYVEAEINLGFLEVEEEQRGNILWANYFPLTD
jgi:hypothetical protein